MVGVDAGNAVTPSTGPQLPTVYCTFCTWAMERYRQKPRREVSGAETGKRNMAENAGMNFLTTTSYSTPYTLGGLSALLVPFCR